MFHYLLVSEHFLNVSFVELTHEFLQILEKTPSRLKRIRNWRVRIIADKLILSFNFASEYARIVYVHEVCDFPFLNSHCDLVAWILAKMLVCRELCFGSCAKCVNCLLLSYLFSGTGFIWFVCIYVFTCS